MVFAAAEGADPRITRQRGEIESVLDRPQIAGQVICAMDGLAVRRPRVELVHRA